jgi:RNA polymerase sigma-32 factor
MRPDEVKIIARQLGVTQTDVIHMNRRLGGDSSLNAPIREEGNSGEWEDRLVDEQADQETTLAASEEFENRRKALASALSALNDRERPYSRRVGSPKNRSRSMSLPTSSASRASACAR